MLSVSGICLRTGFKMTSFLFRGGRKIILAEASLLIALISLADWKIDESVPLGFLYLLPMLMVGGVLNRKQIALLAAFCTFLAEMFDSFAWSPQFGVPRDVLYFSAFSGLGFFVHQVVSSRQHAAAQLQRVESEILARRDAEEQMKILIESSPIAIFTADVEGAMLLANDAAHKLFAATPNSLPGNPMSKYLPSLANVTTFHHGQQSFRTVMQCRGHREDGDMFLADVWFSTYRTSGGPRLAAMVVDMSEDLRDREESGLHQLLTGSRILVGAVSHEIRNVCGAIAVVYENLLRDGLLSHSKDFEALGTLVVALEKIASMKLRETANQTASLNLDSFFEELKIVISPGLREQGIDLHWEVPTGLPLVQADRQSLMQVFLNLVKNSERAVFESRHRILSVGAETGNRRVSIFVKDTGCGVSNPELLFRPFQSQAKATGLGLYLSRAWMRTFQGDLHYRPSETGSCFVVELLQVVESPNPTPANYD